MEIWNNVLALLTLLVTVIIGTAKITWTLAQAIFRDSHRANTIRKNNDKKNDRLGSQSDGGHVF